MKQVLKSVTLPLFSQANGLKFVPPKSGINQWNAGGRERQFGEAYIPVSAALRSGNADFFASKDVNFSLRLPSGRVVNAKMCQAEGKALMTSPNKELCDWLFPQIDGSLEASIRRFVRKDPYAYSDLVRAGFDSVVLHKCPCHECDYILEIPGLEIDE